MWQRCHGNRGKPSQPNCLPADWWIWLSVCPPLFWSLRYLVVSVFCLHDNLLIWHLLIHTPVGLSILLLAPRSFVLLTSRFIDSYSHCHYQISCLSLVSCLSVCALCVGNLLVSYLNNPKGNVANPWSTRGGGEHKCGDRNKKHIIHNTQHIKVKSALWFGVSFRRLFSHSVTELIKLRNKCHSAHKMSHQSLKYHTSHMNLCKWKSRVFFWLKVKVDREVWMKRSSCHHTHFHHGENTTHFPLTLRHSSIHCINKHTLTQRHCV